MSSIKSMKKILSVIITAAVAVTAAGVSTASIADANKVSAAVSGDINGDGDLNIADAVLLQQYLAKKKELSKNVNADFNGDGKVNVFDLVALKKAILGTSVSDSNSIHLKETSIAIEGKNMTLSENNTVVTITASGTYKIDGTLSDGQIRVEAGETDVVTLVLNGANVTCSTGAPICTVSGITVLSLDGDNTLNDSETYSGTEAGSAVSTISTSGDMTVTGSGSLTVKCNNVSAKAAMYIGGALTIKSGSLKVTSAADETDNGGDGISAKNDVKVEGGKVNVNSKGGDAVKSRKGSVTLSGGKITAKAENDAVQAETTIDISDKAEVYAYGKRGLTTGEGYKVDITGGSVIATGNEEITDLSGVAVNAMYLGYTEKLDKAAISVKKDGKEVLNITPDKKYTYALIANSALENGTYEVYTGDVKMTHAGAVKEGEFVKNGTTASYSSVQAVSGGTVADPTPTPAEGNSIVLSDSGITVSGNGATLSADKKTVTISQPETYTVTGEMTGGQIVVDVDKTAYPTGVAELSLEGMSLTNTATSPIYVAAIGDECVISAKKGTVNTVTDGTSYTNADEGVGAIYSKDDLKFKGKGTLNVNGNCEDAIVSKDDIKIHNSTLNITAADDGIRGKESVKIGDPDDTDFSNLNVTVTTKSGDGIKTTDTENTEKGSVTINGGTVKITSYADGIQAERDITVNGGDIDIYTYQGSKFTGTVTGGNTGGWGGGMGMDGNSNKTDISAKGMKAGDTDASIKGVITINGGTINIDSSDDCIHSAGNMYLNGGNMTLASADDACHSDSDLNIGDSTADDYTDVTIYVSKCYEGIEGLNINQNSGSVVVNADDDGYNAAGGADGSGTANPGGWNPGGWGGGRPGQPGGGGGMGGNTGSYSLNIKGGLAFVNSADGDHDGFDSNGSLTISGGIAISNGNETFDADGTKSYTGGIFVTNTGSGGMGGGMGFPGGGSELTTNVSASTSASAGTRISLVDNGKVLVSFIAKKNVTTLTAGCKNNTSAKFSTGGTVSGTPVIEGGDQAIYTSGTLSGGTQVG